MLTIFFVLSSLPHLFAFQALEPYTKTSKRFNLPPGVFVVDPAARDQLNQGPYVGLSDGRILKYNGTDFVDFAYTYPDRPKELCEGRIDQLLGPACGRPIQFSFDRQTGDLYIVSSADGGIFRVGPQGGQATLLTNTNRTGISFHFVSGVDFDQRRKVVYFTDASLIFNYTEDLLGVPTPLDDYTGRLLEYNTITKEVRVLFNNIPHPIGPAVDENSTFVVYSSFTTEKIIKYHLAGPKEGTAEFLSAFPGPPIVITRALENGKFWVPVNVIVSRQPLVINPCAYKINSDGEMIAIKSLTSQFPNSQLILVQEYEEGGASTRYLVYGSSGVPGKKILYDLPTLDIK